MTELSIKAIDVELTLSTGLLIPICQACNLAEMESYWCQFEKEARANIIEMHFLPFNPVDKRTAITNWIRPNKEALEQILNRCQEKKEIAGKVYAIIDKFAEKGLWSLGVAY